MLGIGFMNNLQAQSRTVSMELANSITSSWDSEPKLGLPLPSYSLSIRYKRTYENFKNLGFLAGAAFWLPRTSGDQVGLLKRDPALPDAWATSELRMGAIEVNYGLFYTFKKVSEETSFWYVGMGLGVNAFPFRERVTGDFDLRFYELPRQFRSDEYRSVVVAISVNGHFGRQFKVLGQTTYLESFLHIPANDGLGNLYEIGPRTLLGLRLGVQFNLPKKKSSDS